MGQRVAGGRGRRKPPPVSRAQQQAIRRRVGAAVATVLRADIEAALETVHFSCAPECARRGPGVGLSRPAKRERWTAVLQAAARI